MKNTYVMTLRLPKALGLDIERYSVRTGHKPAKLGAIAVDEFIRRRRFPLIDFRDTIGGRVAYVKGTRIAVYWLVDAIKMLRGSIQKASQLWDISPDKVRAALHYAEVYPDEMKAMQEQEDANRVLLEKAEAALERAKALGKANGTAKTKLKRGQ